MRLFNSFNFHFCLFLFGNTFTVILFFLSGQISLSHIDPSGVTLLSSIRPLLSLMTWKWIDELPALISPLSPAHHQLSFRTLPGRGRPERCHPVTLTWEITIRVKVRKIYFFNDNTRSGFKPIQGHKIIFTYNQ